MSETRAPELARPAGPGPVVRPRRLRRTRALREWVAESEIEARRLVLPLFVRGGDGPPEPLEALPGASRFPVDRLVGLGPQLVEEGIGAVLLFGEARQKDDEGSDAWAEDGVIPRAVRALRRGTDGLVIVTDVCLCAYTRHGHCGVLEDGGVANDASVERLARVAVAHARAGADVVAPSAMMDGQVRGLRGALDAAGCPETAILSYATKHASAFYRPFREVEGSRPVGGDRTGYQMDPRNAREALKEMTLDVAEGADFLMVKPALTSLDLLARARERFDVPLAAFHVSGEYAMLRAAAREGIVDLREAGLETLRAIRRAGADLLVTYLARDAAAWLREGR